jgi:hypothetical protein
MMWQKTRIVLELAARAHSEAKSRSLTASAKYADGIRDDNVKNKAKKNVKNTAKEKRKE